MKVGPGVHPEHKGTTAQAHQIKTREAEGLSKVKDTNARPYSNGSTILFLGRGLISSLPMSRGPSAFACFHYTTLPCSVSKIIPSEAIFSLIFPYLPERRKSKSSPPTQRRHQWDKLTSPILRDSTNSGMGGLFTETNNFDLVLHYYQVWAPRGNYSTSLDFSFLLCKMGSVNTIL